MALVETKCLSKQSINKSNPHVQIAQSGYNIFESPGFWGIKRWTLETGINRHSGNRWYRPQTGAGLFLYYRNNKFFVRKVNNKIWTTSVRLPYAPEIDSYSSRIVDHLGVNIWDHRTIYPVIKYYNSNSVHIPHKYLRAQNPREMVEDIYGKSMYRKDLLKAAGQVDHVSLF